VTTLLLLAYMPETADRMLEALGVEGRQLEAFGSHAGGQSVETLPPLFPKIETAAA
jgi:methionyl-tRNA synthetase